MLQLICLQIISQTTAYKGLSMEKKGLVERDFLFDLVRDTKKINSFVLALTP